MSNSSNEPQGLLANMAFGGVFFLMGSFIVLISADIIHVDPSSFSAPRWVAGAAGGVFMLAGIMVALQAGLPQDSQLFKWLQFFFGMGLMILFTSIALWIGFGPGEREFSSSTSLGPVSTGGSGDDKMGRIVFGGSGILLIFCTIWMGISQLKGIFKDR